MGNNKRKEGLNKRSEIRSRTQRKMEIQKGIEIYKQSREDADDFLV